VGEVEEVQDFNQSHTKPVRLTTRGAVVACARMRLSRWTCRSTKTLVASRRHVTMRLLALAAAPLVFEAIGSLDTVCLSCCTQTAQDSSCVTRLYHATPTILAPNHIFWWQTVGVFWRVDAHSLDLASDDQVSGKTIVASLQPFMFTVPPLCCAVCS
jgi:hypothetical protein